jgi:hypothetical protein
MARDRGEYYKGVDDKAEAKRPAPAARGQLGAMVGAQGDSEVSAQPMQMGQMLQPREDFATLRERNKQFLRDPQTQAALLTFATGMLQPISNSADFMGLVGNSVANAARAAAGVEMAQTEEELLRQKMAMEERKFGLDERQVDLQERRLEAETAASGQKKRSKVIRANDPLNKKFGLGLTGNQQAKVEITEDAEGNIINADLEAEFDSQNQQATAPTEISKLQMERDKAKAEGRVEDAAQLQARIDELSQGTISSTGVTTLRDPTNPTGLRQVPIPGSAAEAAAKTAAQQAAAQNETEQGEMGAAILNIDDAIDMIENPPTVLGMKIPPDAFITGPGSYTKYAGNAYATDLGKMLDSIGARIQLSELKKLKKEGGVSLTPVSNFDALTLRESYYSLHQAQTSGQLIQNLNRFKSMFQDVLMGDQIHTIGEQVKSGDLSPEAAEKKIHALFGAPSLANVTSTPETEQPKDFNSVPPWITDPEQKADWDYMPAPLKQQIWEQGAGK